MQLKHLAVALLLITSACRSKAPPAEPTTEPAKPAWMATTIDPTRLAVFQPLPDVMLSDSNPLSEVKVQLGRMLYFDPRLSKNQDVACVSCHNLERFGVDNLATSEGHRKQRGARNAPSVYNAAGHFVQFWDGRAADVEEQALGPILNPVEMAMLSEAHVIAVVKSIPGYVQLFRAAFPDDGANAVSYKNIGRALAAFERRLLTPSRWDAYLKGDTRALTDAEKAGFNLFIDTGCAICHSGPYLGGHLYQKLGLVTPWTESKDLGRFAVTKVETDRMMFKVPSLRNVAETAPYFHDGSVATLDDAVVKMARHQLGKELTAEQVSAITAFLRSLTGKIPSEYVAKPELPVGSHDTPKPDPL